MVIFKTDLVELIQNFSLYISSINGYGEKLDKYDMILKGGS